MHLLMLFIYTYLAQLFLPFNCTSFVLQPYRVYFFVLMPIPLHLIPWTFCTLCLLSSSYSQFYVGSAYDEVPGRTLRPLPFYIIPHTLSSHLLLGSHLFLLPCTFISIALLLGGCGENYVVSLSSHRMPIPLQPHSLDFLHVVHYYNKHQHGKYDSISLWHDNVNMTHCTHSE